MRVSLIIVVGMFMMCSISHADEVGGMMEGQHMMMDPGKMMAQGGSMMHPGKMMGQDPVEAQAQLYDRDGVNIGNVLFTQEDNGVKIEVSITNIPEGVYALHIHEIGECRAPDFKSSGGHFNPFDKEHGFLNIKGHHAGDLPNIEVEENGKGSMKVTTNYVTLAYGKENSLLKEGGTAVVMHQQPDDYFTDPAGNGGARIACGVITGKALTEKEERK